MPYLLRPTTPSTFLHFLHHHTTTLLHLQSLHALSITTYLSLPPSSILSHLPSLSPLPSSPSYPLSLLHSLTPPTTPPFNLLIQILPLHSLLLFRHLRRLSLPPNSHTFPLTLKSLSQLPPSPSSLLLAQSLHSQTIRFGFHSHLFVANSLVTVYSSLRGLGDAHAMFLSMPIKDVVSYNALVGGYVKWGCLGVARKLFDEMPKRDSVSWGTILAGYAKGGMNGEVVGLFGRMVECGVCPDDVALVAVLSACGRLAALERGRAIHNEYLRSRLKLSVYLSTALVDMYAKCGCVELAVEVFEESGLGKGRNLFTWNAIVVGLAMHGHGELAWEYFERMEREGVPPDGVTLLGVLVGCSHARLIDRARRLFEEMERVYGVKRELKHYGCMADSLGRAGLIDEAMEMIELMPMEADEYVWGGVLAGCRIHGNVEVAEIAARQLLRISPEDSGVYSIMAEIYTAARRWEDVERVRREMDDGKVERSVACSLVEVDIVCHVG